MDYDVYYKKERNGKITINVNEDKIRTPLTNENVAGALCDDIYDYLSKFNVDEYFFEIQLSDESDPLGIIVDIWQDIDIENEQDIPDDEPIDSETFMFDDYSIYDDNYDDDELDYNESEFEDFDE